MEQDFPLNFFFDFACFLSLERGSCRFGPNHDLASRVCKLREKKINAQGVRQGSGRGRVGLRWYMSTA